MNTAAKSYPGAGTMAPDGLGRMTLEHVCRDAGIAMDEAIEQIAKKTNIQATPDMRIIEIAEKAGENPMNIWNMTRSRWN